MNVIDFIDSDVTMTVGNIVFSSRDVVRIMQFARDEQIPLEHVDKVVEKLGQMIATAARRTAAAK